MTDEPTVGGIDVTTLRERLECDPDVEVDETVVATIEARATEERAVSVAAFAQWYEECDRERRAAEERLTEFESRLAEHRVALDEWELELDHVRSQFDEYGEKFDAMRDDLSTAATHLEETPRRPVTAAALYAGAGRLAAVEELTHGVAHRLEHFEQEFDWFASWLTEPTARIEGFDDELDAVEGYLGRVERLLAEAETHAADPPAGYEPFDAWAGARHLHLLATVALDEFRADVGDLGMWLESVDGEHDEQFQTLTDRLFALEERNETLEDRFDAAADAIDDFEAAHAEIAHLIGAFEAELDKRSPPIDWATVNRLLREQFEELGIPYD